MGRGRETRGRGQKGPARSSRAGSRRVPRWMLMAAAVVLAGAGLLLALPPPQGSGSSSAWPRDRGSVGTFVESQTTVDNLTEARITYPSLGGRARAVLWVPNTTNNTTAPLPAVVHMTGRTVPAEGARDLARFLAPLGVVTLSVEKRDGDQDLAPGKTRLWVWDLLRGFDHLRAPLPGNLRTFIDPVRIAVSGDSIGANAALAAASVEPRLKGVMAFSGFPDPRSGPDLDPGAAVGRIQVGEEGANRTVAIFAAREDAPYFNQSRVLFDLAREPKFFYAVNGTCHGYCPGMFPQIGEQVRQLFSLPKPSGGPGGNAA